MSNSPSLSRLKVLTEVQLLELVQDLCDEVDRRAPEAQNHPALKPCLDYNSNFTDSRNQNRQKLATLKTDWFRSLACDVWTETRRRHPNFKQDEHSILQHVAANTRDYQSSDGDNGEEDAVLDEDDVLTTYTEHKKEQRAPPPPSKTRQPEPSSFRDSAYGSSEGNNSHEEVVMQHHTHAEKLKPSWLLNAEEAVKQHIGPNRSSHDWTHADRMRRQALALVRKLSRKRQVDAKVVELAALFAVACNDPKQ